MFIMILDDRLCDMRLTGTNDVIDVDTYPVTTEELLADHGQHEIEFADATETLAECLGRLAPETYESADDVRLSVYTAVSGDAVGRRHYTDRDPTTLDSPYGHDQVSF